MPFTYPWTESEPTDATYVREVDDWLRRLANSVRERLGVEHYTYASESGQVNIGKHKPGSAKISAVPSTGKPVPDGSAPGTIVYETDTQRLVYDTGSAWAALAHKNMHKTGGDDPIAPADIGAVAKAGDTMTGPLAFSLSLPEGVNTADTPDKWPQSGIALYTVAGSGQLQYQPSAYGVILHVALSNVKFQVFFNWLHPGSQNPPGSFWWRHAGEGDPYWSAWARLWSDLNDGPESAMDADTLDGAQPDTSAAANTIAKRDANGDLVARVLRPTDFVQIPVLAADPTSPSDGALWMRA